MKLAAAVVSQLAGDERAFLGNDMEFLELAAAASCAKDSGSKLPQSTEAAEYVISGMRPAELGS